METAETTTAPIRIQPGNHTTGNHTTGNHVAGSNAAADIMYATESNSEKTIFDLGTTDPARPSGRGVRERSGARFRWRRRLSARGRILAWFAFVMTLALASMGFVLGSLLLTGVNNDVAESVQQEIQEFTTFAAIGQDPTTGEAFTTTQSLLQIHLQRQYADEHEVLFGYTDTLIRQARVTPGDPVSDPAIVAAIIDSPAAFGTIETAVGEMLWAKQVAVPAGGLGEGKTPGIYAVGYLIGLERESVWDTISLIAAISLIALLLSLFAAWVAAGRILEPIRLVRHAAAEITEKQLQRRIPVRGHDDVAELSRTFNEMMDRLDAAFAVQRQFVDDASHELRTPITIVKGHLELMSDDPDDREETMRIVSDELDRMHRIVEDLLLLAKSEQPDFIQPRSTSVAELTSDVDAKIRALGDRRWILESMGEGEAIVDAQRITQAMVQLAQNAVQHTEDGDTIRMGSQVHAGLLSLWVTDSGPGVPPEDLSIIFERFSRGSTGGSRSNKRGAGLGLSIVMAIALGHHGRPRAANVHGGGATFGLEIPLTPEIPAPWSSESAAVR